MQRRAGMGPFSLCTDPSQVTGVRHPRSVGDIARALNRSSKTVSTQKVSAMRKLGTRTDQELMVYCLASDLFG